MLITNYLLIAQKNFFSFSCYKRFHTMMQNELDGEPSTSNDDKSAVQPQEIRIPVPYGHISGKKHACFVFIANHFVKKRERIHYL